MVEELRVVSAGTSKLEMQGPRNFLIFRLDVLPIVCTMYVPQ